MTGTGFFQVAVDGAQIFRKRLPHTQNIRVQGSHTHTLSWEGAHAARTVKMNTVSVVRDVPVFAEDLWPICIDKRGQVQ